MKANELMIGDWVAIGNNFIRVTSLQVSRNYPEANPIPLTAEILEKNGFVVEPEYCYDNPLQYCEIIDGLWISISGEKYFEGKLEYVHELQHALRLCGIDKEIVL